MRRAMRVGTTWAVGVAVALGWAALGVAAGPTTSGVAANGTATTTPAGRAAADGPHDVLAEATAESLAVAVVEPRRPDGFNGGSASPAEQTRILVRANRPGESWRPLSVLPGRAVGLAARDAALVVLMADGSWQTVWAGGSATGQPLPAHGRLRAVADDGKSLWAIGQVPGGRAAVEAEQTTRPTTASAVTTAPTATTASLPEAEPGPRVRLVVFCQREGLWDLVAELGPEVPAIDGRDLALAVVGGQPVVAYRLGDRMIRTIAWTGAPGSTGGKWTEVGGVGPVVDRPIAAFALLADASPIGPTLWTSGGAGDPGRLRVQAIGPTTAASGAAGSARDRPVPLPWPSGQLPLTGVPTAVVAGHYVRVIGPAPDGAGGEVAVEQRYDAATGLAVGRSAKVLPDYAAAPVAALWVEWLLLASLAFAVGTTVYRQVTPVPAGASNGRATRAVGVAPAPLGRRLLAGLIDLVPVLIAVVAAAVQTRGDESVPLSSAVRWGLVIAAVVYLLHTTVLEALTARSAGKWATGLRVATPDGGRPAVGALVGRNLLRAVDPLVWILFSPERQRTADVLVGTVVVPAVGPPSTEGSEA